MPPRFRFLFAFMSLWALSTTSAIAHPIMNESPMEPGLWSMTIVGTVHVPSANVNEPIHRHMQICIKAHEPITKPFLPKHQGNCTTTHAPMANGHEQWMIHCTAPHAIVNQDGWIQSLPQTFDSHWQMKEDITEPDSYTTETTMQIKGSFVRADCGSVQ